MANHLATFSVGSIGKFISALIDSGRRRIKLLVFGKADARIFYESMPFGEDSIPLADARAIVIQTEEKGKMVVIGYINTNQLEGLSEGEKRIYSLQPDGQLSQFIHLKSDETMEIGGNADFMVRYNELETAFNQLQTDHDAFVTTYNTHNHPTAPTGPVSPPSATESASTADITPAKIDEIKTL